MNYMLVATYMKLACNGEGQIEATHTLSEDQGEAGQEFLAELAQRTAARGFWADTRTFIPPAALVKLEIVEDP